MQMTSKLAALLAGALSLGLVTAASAADMAVKARPVAAPVLVYDWTGFYIGADVGGRWSDPTWTTTCLQPGFAATCVPGNFPALYNFNNPSKFESSSVKGGVYGGYNWQMSSWVAGIEGDVQWGNNSKSKAGIPGAESPTAVGAPGLDRSQIKQT
jgi:outer membrane immunogenic protein